MEVWTNGLAWSDAARLYSPPSTGIPALRFIGEAVAFRSSSTAYLSTAHQHTESERLRGFQRHPSNYPKTGCNPRKIQALRAFSDSYLPAALVTGAAGFIGSHLVRELLRLGRVRVVALDDLSGGYRHNGADGPNSSRPASPTTRPSHTSSTSTSSATSITWPRTLRRGSRTSSGGSTTRTT